MATTAPDRIPTLDIVRGVAVMGILLMNIVGMGLIQSAYMNPNAMGGAQGLDLGVYLVNFVLFDGKMRGLFSVLFGASMLLVIERAEAKGESPARVHYLRMVWLLVFGLIHLWLIWWGDILSHYALIGMIAFLFRKAQLKTLMATAITLLVVEQLTMLMLPFVILLVQEMATSANPELAAKGVTVMVGLQNKLGVPNGEKIRELVDLQQSGYGDIVADRFKRHIYGPITGVFVLGWETLAYMLLGMAGLKTGMLTGAWTPERYRRWMLVGFGIGVPAYVALAAYLVRADFSMLAVTTGVMALTVAVRPLMIIGWACLIILATRSGGALVTRIAATGRMAFTNYLMTSVIMTTIFYGYGFGLYGELSRAELYPLVFAMWALMLLWSKPWLARFRYGPLEWLWRSLSRMRFQPMQGGAISA